MSVCQLTWKKLESSSFKKQEDDKLPNEIKGHEEDEVGIPANIDNGSGEGSNFFEV